MKYPTKEIANVCEKISEFAFKNFSDKDAEFTDIPLQTMIYDEAIVNEATEYCCSGEFNLPEKYNLLSFFKKFTENKFVIYFKERIIWRLQISK